MAVLVKYPEPRMPVCEPEFWRRQMVYGYSTRPIAREQIDLAFILVDAAGLAIARREWQSFCSRVIEWRGATGLHDDVIVTTDVDGHVKGLFVTEMIQSLLFGRVLEVPVFLTASAADEDGVITELLQAVRGKAREANCDDVRIWTLGGESWMRVTRSNPAETHYKGVQLKLV